MKKTQKNSIIIGLVINFTILIGLILFFLLYIYPEILKIENDKEELLNIQEKYNTIKKRGLSYHDFNSIKNIPVSIFQKKILSKINKQFYDENFTNVGNKYDSFDEFLDSLDSKIKGDLKENYEKNKKGISNIIPVYTDNSDNRGKGRLTDFKFVNLIENLLYKNNLSTISPIGIKRIEKIEEFSDSKGESDLSSDIFVITLPLKLEGRKSQIINFMQDINKMGKISLCTIDDISEQRYGCVNENQLIISDLNLFSEVNSIKMDKYIDSSSFTSNEDKGKGLVELLLTSEQKRENFNMEVELLFYVQGLPNYKLKATIVSVLGNLSKNSNLSEEEKLKAETTNYLSLKARVKTLKSKFKNNKLALRKLNEIDTFLNSLSKEINVINKDLLKGKNLLENYNKVEQYKSIFLLISNRLDKLENNLKHN